MAGSSMKDIKRRIKSVESTGQITKAMELVSSAKLRKAKEAAEKARPYFHTLYEVMSEIASSNTDFSSIYTQKSDKKSNLVIVVAGDRGLAGGYNINVLRLASTLLNDQSKIIAIGKKAVDFFGKSGHEVVFSVSDIESNLSIKKINDIGAKVVELYKSGNYGSVEIVFTQFISPLVQEPIKLKVLPLDVTANMWGSSHSTAKEAVEYEPSGQEVFDTIAPSYVKGVIYGAIVESFASEQGARRTAMESASDNAKDMIDRLSLSYNRARQAAITQEISEIVSGANVRK